MSSTNGSGHSSEHIGELAELYALGLLEPHESAPLETHLAGCATCARAVGEATATVAELNDTFVARIEPPERLGSRIASSARAVVPFEPRAGATKLQTRQPRFARGLMATAAGLLLAVGIGGGGLLQRSADVGQATQDSTVLATIASSHFNHVSLRPHDPAAPISKVLYARDGSWFYLIVAANTCGCRVIATSKAGRRDVGKPEARGTTATLFVRDFPRPTSLELVDGSGRMLADAQFVYMAR